MVKLLTNKFVTPKIRVTPKVRIRIARRWLKSFGIFVLTAGIAGGVFFLVFKSDLLVVKNINCWVEDKTSIADEKRWCETVKREALGQRIFLLKQQTIAGEIRKKFLPVGDVVIKRKYPQTVLVQISERKPIAKVCQSGGREFLVDKEGVVYSEVTPESKELGVVILELGAELGLGQKIDAAVVSLILLEDPQVSSIKFADRQEMEIKADEQLIIFLSREKNLESQLQALQMIVKKYRIEGKDLKQIDLRFDQPVVRY